MVLLCSWLAGHGSSCLELVAVVFGVVSVFLSVRENIWSWPTAIVNVSLFFVLFFESGLYSDMGLQVAYFGLSLYGWYEWLYGGRGRTVLKVSRTRPRVWAVLAVIAVVLWASLGKLTSRLPGVSLPYVDAATTTTSLVAQWMMTRKLLENWLLWVVVDVAYIAMFVFKGLYLTAANYAIYLVLAAMGYLAWKRSLARHVIRVVLTGSECTGKSTLAAELARHYRVEVVPEFVRTYAEKKGSPIDFSDHGPIARGQMALEDESMARAAHLVVQDTDLLVPVVYCRHYFGRCPAWIEEAAAERRPSLYLLCSPDIPWMADGVRDRGHMRQEMHEMFRRAVTASGAPSAELRGNRGKRLADAIENRRQTPGSRREVDQRPKA